MRAAIFLSVLALSCSAAQSEDDTLEISTLASGGYAASEAKTAVLATTDAEYQRLWSELIGTGEGSAPQADLATGVVVFLLAGTRSTGGWTVEPSAINIESDGTAVIVAKIKGPPAGSITTQALTSPYAVVHVADRNVRKVRWAE